MTQPTRSGADARHQRLLAELIPGQGQKDLTALQAKAILATVRPRDIAGRTRRRIAVEELADLVAVEAKMKKATAELKTIVLARGSRLMDIHGVGPVVAARILADVGDITRFADRNRFASWTGTAPLDASSGEQNCHRLSRAGNRRMNHVIHIAAVTQIRLDTEGRAYYRRKRAAGRGFLPPSSSRRCSEGCPWVTVSMMIRTCWTMVSMVCPTSALWSSMSSVNIGVISRGACMADMRAVDSKAIIRFEWARSRSSL